MVADRKGDCSDLKGDTTKMARFFMPLILKFWKIAVIEASPVFSQIPVFYKKSTASLFRALQQLRVKEYDRTENTTTQTTW